MRLDQLPHVTLHEICLKLEAKDITSLQDTNRNLFHHIRTNRLHYNKKKVLKMKMTLTKDGQRTVRVIFEDKFKVKITLSGLTDEMIKWFNPGILISYDHDELANMHQLWWRQITKIHLFEIIDLQRYLPHFDRCTEISLRNDNPMRLSDILASMETKHLERLIVLSDKGVECTDEDFRKIGKLSNKMKYLSLGNYSNSTSVSNDAILDMLEFGSFVNYALVELSRLQSDMLQCLRKRGWPTDHRRFISRSNEIEKPNGFITFVKKWNTDRINVRSNNADSDAESLFSHFDADMDLTSDSD